MRWTADPYARALLRLRVATGVTLLLIGAVIMLAWSATSAASGRWGTDTAGVTAAPVRVDDGSTGSTDVSASGPAGATAGSSAADAVNGSAGDRAAGLAADTAGGLAADTAGGPAVSAQNGLAADVEADSTRAATDVAEEIAVGSAGAGDQHSPAELLQLAAGIAIVVVLFAAGYRSRYGDEPRPLSAMASVPAVRPARRPRRRIPAARVPASGRSGALSRDWGLSGIGGGRPVGTVSG